MYSILHAEMCLCVVCDVLWVYCPVGYFLGVVWRGVGFGHPAPTSGVVLAVSFCPNNILVHTWGPMQSFLFFPGAASMPCRDAVGQDPLHCAPLAFHKMVLWQSGSLHLPWTIEALLCLHHISGGVYGPAEIQPLPCSSQMILLAELQDVRFRTHRDHSPWLAYHLKLDDGQYCTVDIPVEHQCSGWEWRIDLIQKDNHAIGRKRCTMAKCQTLQLITWQNYWKKY